MEANIVIRDGKPNDISRALEIVFPILRDFGIEPDPVDFDSDITNFGKQDADLFRSFAAEVDGKVMGALTLQLQDVDGPKITGVFVSADSRRQGLGRRLIDQAIAEAKEMGSHRIHLETREIFADAVRLYESTGWIRGADLARDYGPNRTYHRPIASPPPVNP